MVRISVVERSDVSETRKRDIQPSDGTIEMSKELGSMLDMIKVDQQIRNSQEIEDILRSHSM